MKDITLIIVVVAITTVVITGGVLFTSRANPSSQADQDSDAKVSTQTTTHTWGDIGINDGHVEASFQIANDGTQLLKLFDVSTSCMCTTAQIKVGDSTSPSFGMHTKSRYTAEVPPGETAELNVTFDPAYHGPSGIGPVTRQVTMKTNDPEHPELTFQMTGNVVR